MPWLTAALAGLAAKPAHGYYPDQTPASEPTALAALALLAHDRAGDAAPLLAWLAQRQDAAGGVSVRAPHAPAWPTSLAALAWLASKEPAYQPHIGRATRWIIASKGVGDPQLDVIGHDTTLVAWSWVDGTHSWIEPTALHVLALRAAGWRQHTRAREAVRLLLDRQLPEGGCNFGNTLVLGNATRAHAQPSGLALLALAGEADHDPRVARTVAWLRRGLSPRTTAASLAWGLLGLSAHDARPAPQAEWLAAAADRVLARDRSPHKLALLALADRGSESPLVALPRADAAAGGVNRS